MWKDGVEGPLSVQGSWGVQQPGCLLAQPAQVPAADPAPNIAPPTHTLPPLTPHTHRSPTCATSPMWTTRSSRAGRRWERTRWPWRSASSGSSTPTWCAPLGFASKAASLEPRCVLPALLAFEERVGRGRGGRRVPAAGEGASGPSTPGALPPAAAGAAGLPAAHAGAQGDRLHPAGAPHSCVLTSALIGPMVFRAWPADELAAHAASAASAAPAAPAAQMVAMIQRIIDHGHAYAVEGGDVFFDVASLPGYGKLSGRSQARLGADRAARVWVLCLVVPLNAEAFGPAGSLPESALSPCMHSSRCALPGLC